jgi:hypothetical protein
MKRGSIVQALFRAIPSSEATARRERFPRNRVPIQQMNAYSVDLREKVLTAYHHQEGSIRQLAKRVTVSPRFVGELISRFRRTGS